MKQSTTVLQRQNDPEAIRLYKASQHCLQNERVIKYLMIVFSFGICITAILNKYLPQIFPMLQNVETIQQKAATYINLISGAILVAGVPLGFYCSRMHTEGTVLQDRFESYVFDNSPNLSMLRPISLTYVARYAHSLHKPDALFTNKIFPENEKVNDATAQYEYIVQEVHNDFDLYLSIQPFFLTIWIGFCILIIGIAVSFNDMFVTTLINILIPSLSAITTICTAWYNYKLQMRQLSNLMNCIERIENLSQEKKKQYINNKENMRLLADGLYNYRASAFVIPTFLVKHHIRTMEKEKLSEELANAEAAARLAANVDEEKNALRKKVNSPKDQPAPRSSQQPTTKHVKQEEPPKAKKEEPAKSTNEKSTTAKASSAKIKK